MTIQATTRKIKRSFTLRPESVAFVSSYRRDHKAASDSEALDMLLRELQLEARRRELDAEVTAYYDNASDEELREAEEWAKATGPNMFAGIPE